MGLAHAHGAGDSNGSQEAEAKAEDTKTIRYIKIEPFLVVD